MLMSLARKPNLKIRIEGHIKFSVKESHHIYLTKHLIQAQQSIVPNPKNIESSRQICYST